MKRILCFAVAGIALASCTNDEVVNEQTDNDADAIRFRTAVTNSRSVVTNAASIQSSGFWSRAVRPNGNNQWGSTNGMLKYEASGSTYAATGADGIDLRWPTYPLAFYATNLNPDEYTISSTNPMQITFKPKVEISDQVDFVYATNYGTRWDFANSVLMNFKHALVQIEIKLKNTNEDYQIRVKGYKIHHVISGCTYVLPQNSCSNDDGVIGSWTTSKHILEQTDYVYTYSNKVSENSIYDNAGDYWTIRSDGHTFAQTAMLVPIEGHYTGSVSDGPYIAILAQVNRLSNGSVSEPIYPSYEEGSTTDRVSYRGLPNYYGYIFIPITIDWSGCQGKKVTYTIDFSNGLGRVDRLKTDTVDGETYDPSTDDLSGTNPNPGGTDHYSAGDEIINLGPEMTYGLSVGAWTSTSTSITL
jgi:hypothetical protein